MSKHRTLEESGLFTQQIAQIGNARDLDAALHIVTWALCRNPEEFDVVPGTLLRVAKTVRYIRGTTEVPPLRILFRIVNDDTVELLAVSAIPENELED